MLITNKILLWNNDFQTTKIKNRFQIKLKSIFMFKDDRKIL